MINPKCPFSLKNPNVLITQKCTWDRSQKLSGIDDGCDLTNWARKSGFGVQTPGFLITDSPALQTLQDVEISLVSKGMTHNPALDPILIESFEL
jgi:hypothetical protein